MGCGVVGLPLEMQDLAEEKTVRGGVTLCAHLEVKCI